MILGFDGKPLLMQKTGIGMYTDRLLTALCSLDPGLRFRVHLPFSVAQLGSKADEYRQALRSRYGDAVSFVGTVFPPKLRRWVWQNSSLMPVDGIIGEVDLFHATNLVMPPLGKGKGIFTLYDLTFLLLPEYHVKGMRAFARQTRRYAERADGLIAISEHTKRDAVEHLGIPPERIRVTLLAADGSYRVIDDRDGLKSVCTKYGIDREFILYTGTLEPRKNLPVLIRAFHQVKMETGIPHRLVLAGKKGWLYEEIFAEVNNLGLEEEVIFTGYMPDEDLPYLYNAAALFAYPSLYEGFGLPPLEAMACGCPVVTSNASSLPEVVGDAGLMVDPHRVDDLAAAMTRVLQDSGFAAVMRTKGLARAAGFSWERCGRETLSVYRDLTGKS